jgi:hypothetical protein
LDLTFPSIEAGWGTISLATDLAPWFFSEVSIPACAGGAFDPPPWPGPTFQAALSVWNSPTGSGLSCTVRANTTIVAFASIPLPPDTDTHTYKIHISATGNVDFIRDGIVLKTFASVLPDANFYLILEGANGIADNVLVTAP